jgi:hypothetical protein
MYDNGETLPTGYQVADISRRRIQRRQQHTVTLTITMCELIDEGL